MTNDPFSGEVELQESLLIHWIPEQIPDLQLNEISGGIPLESGHGTDDDEEKEEEEEKSG